MMTALEPGQQIKKPGLKGNQCMVLLNSSASIFHVEDTLHPLKFCVTLAIGSWFVVSF